jgi:hypothetical protein
LCAQAGIELARAGTPCLVETITCGFGRLSRGSSDLWVTDPNARERALIWLMPGIPARLMECCRCGIEYGQLLATSSFVMQMSRAWSR